MAASIAASELLIIGVGNEYRSDDGVGILLARGVRRSRIPRVRVIEQSGEGASLLDAWKGVPAVLILDAVSSGAAPGTIHRLDANRHPIPKNFFRYSTHAFSVAEAVELARVLHALPPILRLYGIEGGNFAAGTGLSPTVETAASNLLRELKEEIIPHLVSCDTLRP